LAAALLPEQYFCSADAAYPLSRKILTPFGGADANEELSVEHTTIICVI
jgi:hypothetical protein